jgi:hypothetical protein
MPTCNALNDGLGIAPLQAGGRGRSIVMLAGMRPEHREGQLILAGKVSELLGPFAIACRQAEHALAATPLPCGQARNAPCPCCVHAGKLLRTAGVVFAQPAHSVVDGHQNLAWSPDLRAKDHGT